jgi:protein O-mannosyl-transferase
VIFRRVDPTAKGVRATSRVIFLPPQQRIGWSDLGIVIGLIAITIVIYLPVAWFEFVALDDPQYVTQSELVRNGLDPIAMWGALTEFHADNWHPLVWWSLMLDVELFGLQPGPFHLVNLAWFVINVVVLYFAMKELTGDRWRGALVAAVFAVHPLHVESVAWVTERKDVLSGAFWMLGLWAYARWARTLESKWWWLVTGGIVAGLMSKQIVVTLPCVFLLLDGWPLGRWEDLRLGSTRGRRLWSLLREKLVWFGMCAAAILIVMQAQTQGRKHADDWPLALRISNAVLSVLRYLGKTFWPANLSVQYSYNPPESQIPVIIAAAVVVAITMIASFAYRKTPWVTVGWLWFLGTLMPVIGLIQVGKQSMADRYMYLPIIGLSIALAWMIPTPRSRSAPWIWAGVLVMGLLGLATRTVQQVMVWRNTETLFQHALKIDPTNDSAHYVIASLDLAARRVPEGMAHLQTAVEWERKRWEARRLYAGNPQPEKVAELNRWWADIYFQIGQANLTLGKSTDALAMLREAVKLDPKLIDARMTLGKALAEAGDVTGARQQFTEVLRMSPGHPAAKQELARLRE